jgi:hypothetical protein
MSIDNSHRMKDVSLKGPPELGNGRECALPSEGWRHAFFSLDLVVKLCLMVLGGQGFTWFSSTVPN